MHVEWYYEDFSDPEAVSGSSTNNFLEKMKMCRFGTFLCSSFKNGVQKILWKSG